MQLHTCLSDTSCKKKDVCKLGTPAIKKKASVILNCINKSFKVTEAPLDTTQITVSISGTG